MKGLIKQAGEGAAKTTSLSHGNLRKGKEGSGGNFVFPFLCFISQKPFLVKKQIP